MTAARGAAWPVRLLDALASPQARIFLTAWALYALHFATNIVREHYPAFALVEQGTLRVDRYQGFHSDLFEHVDGHWYINNNVGASLVAAVPLLVFRPLLDALEEARARSPQAPDAGDYRTKYPLRREFFARVKAAGLDLRFGAAAAITAVLLMAPLSALCCVAMYRVLATRGTPPARSAWLALLLGFGTPIFFRTGHLNHNLLVMFAVFGAFLLLWPMRDEPSVSIERRFLAGLLAGAAVNFDLSGAVPALVLLGYTLVCGWRRGFAGAAAYAAPLVCGGLPMLGLFMGCQWAQFGDPFRPAQAWMKAANYTDRGYQGFAWPSLDLALANLFDPAYGLLTFGPLLALAFLPSRRQPQARPILPPRERRMVFALFGLFLIFCSANQYARMQWNTGFRYFAPLVPLLFLAASDVLARLPRGWLAVLTIATVWHSWVLAMARDSVPQSWQRFWSEGVNLPWLSVLRQTRPPGAEGLLGHPWLPMALVTGTAAALCAYQYWANRRLALGAGHAA